MGKKVSLCLECSRRTSKQTSSVFIHRHVTICITDYAKQKTNKHLEYVWRMLSIFTEDRSLQRTQIWEFPANSWTFQNKPLVQFQLPCVSDSVILHWLLKNLSPLWGMVIFLHKGSDYKITTASHCSTSEDTWKHAPLHLEWKCCGPKSALTQPLLCCLATLSLFCWLLGRRH